MPMRYLQVSNPISENYLYSLVSEELPLGGGAPSLTYHILNILLEVQNEDRYNGDILELGVWTGHTLTLLAASALADQQVIAADISQQCIDQTFARITAKLADHINSRNLVPICGSSGLPRFSHLIQEVVRGEGIRFAHIDGEHSREMVLQDAMTIAPFMAPWGLLCFDDIFNPLMPCVTEGFFQFVAGSDWKLLVFMPNKAIICRERYFPYYREICASIPDFLKSERQIIAGLTTSSHYPGHGYLSIFPHSLEYYQVVSRSFESREDFENFRPTLY